MAYAASRRSRLDAGVPLRHAFVDESVRPGSSYLICAAVIAAHDASDMRATMKSLRVPGSRRVHMASDGGYRNRLVAAVAALDVEVLIYRASVKGVSQRQARSDCLRRMVPDLVAVGVSNLYLESCDQDAADRLVLGQARASESRLHFDHRKPHEDPMLWVPDVIAWAWGRDKQWRQKVDHLVTVVIDVAA